MNSPPEITTVARLVRESMTSMELEGLVPCLQEPATSTLKDSV
jgi:hypothetical protein